MASAVENPPMHPHLFLNSSFRACHCVNLDLKFSPTKSPQIVHEDIQIGKDGYND